MQDEDLALSIVQAVVDAAQPYGAPVTLKMRTGWSAEHRNVVSIARQAESAGVQMITVHGRTREQGYKGQAEYDSIAQVKAAVRIPVVANGDIDSPQKAQAVLQATGADAVMIGRAAQGRPWIFREIDHFLQHGTLLAPPLVAEVQALAVAPLARPLQLVRCTHRGAQCPQAHRLVHPRLGGRHRLSDKHMNRIEDCDAQLAAVSEYFDRLAQNMATACLLPSPLARHFGDRSMSKKQH